MQWYVEIDILFSTGGNINGYDKTKRKKSTYVTALLLFNVMFAMLDWYNSGLSFVIGLIWIWAYKKSGHLISSMIAHGEINIISLIYWIMVAG